MFLLYEASGGNQVDGLPPASINKTEDKRARAGARTTIRLTLENKFSRVIAPCRVLVNSIIVVNNILKFIEIASKLQNDFETSEFYRSRMFEKVEKV